MRSTLLFLTRRTRLLLQRSHSCRLLLPCWLLILHSHLFPHTSVPVIFFVGSLGDMRGAILTLLVSLGDTHSMVVDGVGMRTDVLTAICQFMLEGLGEFGVILLGSHFLLSAEMLGLLSHVLVLVLLQRRRQELLQVSFRDHIRVVLPIDFPLLAQLDRQLFPVEGGPERMGGGNVFGKMMGVHGQLLIILLDFIGFTLLPRSEQIKSLKQKLQMGIHKSVLFSIKLSQMIEGLYDPLQKEGKDEMILVIGYVM